jgi:hypothetical protein
MNWRSLFRRTASGSTDQVTGPEAREGDGRIGRRNALGRMAGLAVAGAVVERALAGLRPVWAAAATTVASGATAPTVVALTDAATISVDASAGSDFRVAIAGNRTLGNPANPADGQQVIFQVTQGSGGGYTLSYGTAYEFSAGLPQPTLSATAGHTDLLGFIYNATRGTWLLAAFVNGFS